MAAIATPAATPQEAETKGTNLVGTLRSLREIQGEGVYASVLDALGGPARDPLRLGQIMPVGWYPVSYYVEMHAAIQKVTGGGNAIIRSLARATTRHDFTGIHRLLVRMLSPGTAARHTHRLFQLYWRGGKAEAIDARDGLVAVRFTRWQGFDAAVWEDLAGSIEAFMEVVGASAPRARVLRMSQGRCDADIEVRYL